LRIREKARFGAGIGIDANVHFSNAALAAGLTPQRIRHPKTHEAVVALIVVLQVGAFIIGPLTGFFVVFALLTAASGKVPVLRTFKFFHNTVPALAFKRSFISGTVAPCETVLGASGTASTLSRRSPTAGGWDKPDRSPTLFVVVNPK